VDFKRRYYNDKLGLVWALLHPLLRIAIYYYIFKYVFQVREEDYGIFLFSGLILWMFFAEISKSGMRVFRSKRYLIESVQVKKIDLFYSQVLASFLGFLFNLASFYIIAAISGIIPTIHVLWLPILLLQVLVISFGASLFLAVTHLYFNDIQHAYDILILLGFWTAGIFFPPEQILAGAPWIKYVHPFLGIVDNMRNISMYGTGINWEFFWINSAAAVVILAAGLAMFYGFSHKVLERL